MDFVINLEEEDVLVKNSILPAYSSNSGELISNEKLRIFDYIKKVNQFPILTEEEEKNLLEDFFQNRNIKAGHVVLNSHLRLVVKIAMQYKRYHASLLDLIAEGNLGLLKALKNFSLEKKVRFATYAMLWVKASIREFLIKSISSIKAITTNSQKKLLFGLTKAKKFLGVTQLDVLTEKQLSDIAKLLNIDAKEITEYERMMSETREISLNETKFEEGAIEIGDVTSNGENLAEISIIKNSKELLKAKLQNALQELSPKEAEIIKLRMLGGEKNTLSTLSERFGISKERVRQIQENALKKLKKILEEDEEFYQLYTQL